MRLAMGHTLWHYRVMSLHHAIYTERSQMVKALELFSGIGGFAEAVRGTDISIVGAVDQSPLALETYRLNFPFHPVRQVDLERVTTEKLSAFEADFWWLSPPCQPYSVRGERKDVADPRARSLLRLIDVLSEMDGNNLPRSLGLENVEGFADSTAHRLLTDVLGKRGYRWRGEFLCPTALGIPSRRPRYYLTASKEALAPSPPRSFVANLRLSGYLNSHPDGKLRVPDETVDRFGEGFRLLDPDDPGAYTTCFTAGYGRSLMHAGSYLKSPNGVRRFSPEEVLRLLGFPAHFRFPEKLPLRKRWHLAGNSLSVTVVREVLRAFPEFRIDDTGFPMPAPQAPPVAAQ